MHNNPATQAINAIHKGDQDTLRELLKQNPDLVVTRVHGPRTLLHVATDWPGHFPSNVETVRLLIEHGADVNARFEGQHTETPLHWAASSDDVAVIDALLDAGADIEAPGAVIGGGTPIADAVAFGQWKAAARLLERGACTNLWQSAALGLMDRVSAQLPAASAEEITKAFWLACHGGQRGAAEALLNRGADINWVGYDNLTPLDAALRSEANELAEWLRTQGAKSTKELP